MNLIDNNMKLAENKVSKSIRSRLKKVNILIGETVQLPIAASNAVSNAVSKISLSKSTDVIEKRQSPTRGIARARNFGGFNK